MSKTILITGISGFIGGHLVRHFYNKSYHIIGICRSNNVPEDIKNMVKLVNADLSSDPLPAKVDVIIHAAGLADDRASWSLLYKNNVISTQRLYEEVTHKKFIHISSSSVYPPSFKDHVEDEVIDPKLLTHYGRSKLLCDNYLIENNKRQKQIYILRPRAVYGLNDRTLLPRLLKLKKGKFYITPGKLEYRVSLTHIDNLIQAVDLCLNDTTNIGTTIYNVADEKIHTLSSVIDSVVMNSSNTIMRHIVLPIQLVKALIRFGECVGLKLSINSSSLDILCQDNILNTAKISNELGYNPIQDFDSSIIEILKQY